MNYDPTNGIIEYIALYFPYHLKLQQHDQVEDAFVWFFAVCGVRANWLPTIRHDPKLAFAVPTAGWDYFYNGDYSFFFKSEVHAVEFKLRFG